MGKIGILFFVKKFHPICVIGTGPLTGLTWPDQLPVALLS